MVTKIVNISFLSFFFSVGASFKPTQDESSPTTCQTEINPADSSTSTDHQAVNPNPNPDSSENTTPVKSTSKAAAFFNTKMSSEKKPPKSPDESDCKLFLLKNKLT